MAELLAHPRTLIADATIGLFAHAEYPLEHSLDHRGDPGLFGPGSSTWNVMGDVSTMVGGIRALVMQTAHPEVVAGVRDHSAYRDDPLGRLSRTTSYVTATAYGAMPEVESAVEAVRNAHRPVKGVSERGRPYSAGSPAFASWVHNVLVDSFLTAYQTYAPEPLSASDADRFVAEQTALGALLRADDLPTTAAGLHRWIATHPEIQRTDALREAMTFLSDPPLPGVTRIGYQALHAAAVATIPPRLRTITGVGARGSKVAAGKALLATMRWALGPSPSWWLALERVGAPMPEHVMFLRPPAVEGVKQRFIETTTRFE
jgi:uncharacterized protein (DUF2236 family)